MDKLSVNLISKSNWTCPWCLQKLHQRVRTAFFFSTTHNVIKVGVQNQTSLTRAMVRGFLEFLLFLFSIRHALLLLVTPLKIGAKTWLWWSKHQTTPVFWHCTCSLSQQSFSSSGRNKVVGNVLGSTQELVLLSGEERQESALLLLQNIDCRWAINSDSSLQIELIMICQISWEH